MAIDFTQAGVYSDINALSEVKLAAKNDSPEALKEVAKQFESLFLKMMLKTMRDANETSGLFNSDQMKLYQDMYDQQLSLHLSERSNIGIADILVRQLGGKYGLDNEQKGSHSLSNSINTEKSFAEPVSSTQGPDTNAKFSSPESFINELRPLADKYAKELGVKPEVLLAQAALETGWGKKIIHSADGKNSHNLFAIKASRGWQGEKAYVKTLEHSQGTFREEYASFRAYDSFEESFSDYVEFIKNSPRYQEALKEADDSYHYVSELQNAGYATDPKYAKKIIDILQRDDLTTS